MVLTAFPSVQLTNYDLKSAFSFVQTILIINPENRPSSKQAADHPFFTNVLPLPSPGNDWMIVTNPTAEVATIHEEKSSILYTVLKDAPVLEIHSPANSLKKEKNDIIRNSKYETNVNVFEKTINCQSKQSQNEQLVKSDDTVPNNSRIKRIKSWFHRVFCQLCLCGHKKYKRMH